MKSTQEKIADIERDGNSSFDVSEMEVQPRVELDARVRAEQMLSTKLTKVQEDEMRRGHALKILDGNY